jgi:hypothetical protein
MVSGFEFETFFEILANLKSIPALLGHFTVGLMAVISMQRLLFFFNHEG